MFLMMLSVLINTQSLFTDVQVGDCLSVEKVEQLVGVENPDLYFAGKCQVDYPPDGKVEEKTLCMDPAETGKWSRKILEHKQFGIFFPHSVPCYASVVELQYEHTHYSEW